MSSMWLQRTSVWFIDRGFDRLTINQKRPCQIARTEPWHVITRGRRGPQGSVGSVVGPSRVTRPLLTSSQYLC